VLRVFAFYKTGIILLWEPPTVTQTTRLLPSAAVIQMARLRWWHSHKDGQTPLITVKQTSKLLGQQTPRSGCRQFLYTAAHGRTIQVLANQRPELQLRLQLARTQPSGNGIKCGPPASSFSQSVSISRSDRSVPPAPASVAAPLSAGVRHSSGPLARAATLCTVDS
jgi:hypothetical protein